MLNQAKERIESLEGEIDDANDELTELKQKIDNRNAKIAQLAKGKGTMGWVGGGVHDETGLWSELLPAFELYCLNKY